MHWLAEAPANIALIKYMGKKEGSGNLPDNASLSYTLPNLISTVKIKTIASGQDRWEPLAITNAPFPFTLSAHGQARYLTHLARIKSFYNYSGGLLVQSGNNFPHSSGLASSASSFAALTKCATVALSAVTGQPLLSIDEQAQFSRLGSGSSCRSFYGPWALWEEDEVKAVTLPYQTLNHEVVVISNKEKKVSSSEAHQRVKNSPLYTTRNARAEENLSQLLTALKAEDWAQAYQISWREFQDMHNLFKTCQQPFTYMDEPSINLLNILQQMWDKTGDGPIVTMDAGPNIHLLYRMDQLTMAKQFKQDFLVGQYDVL